MPAAKPRQRARDPRRRKLPTGHETNPLEPPLPLMKPVHKHCLTVAMINVCERVIRTRKLRPALYEFLQQKLKSSNTPYSLNYHSKKKKIVILYFKDIANGVNCLETFKIVDETLFMSVRNQ